MFLWGFFRMQVRPDHIKKLTVWQITLIVVLESQRNTMLFRLRLGLRWVRRGAELSTDHHLVVSWISWQNRKPDRPGGPKRILRVCRERLAPTSGGASTTSTAIVKVAARSCDSRTPSTWSSLWERSCWHQLSLLLGCGRNTWKICSIPPTRIPKRRQCWRTVGWALPSLGPRSLGLLNISCS